MLEHELWMEKAFTEAEKAYQKNEVPVGAVIVYNNKIIGRGHNLIETLQDPTAHAEMLAITAAANSLTSWRLLDTSLYTTLEPCTMCAGAILLSRIKKVFYGAKDNRMGACGSTLNIFQDCSSITTVEVTGGIQRDKCQLILKSFFKKLRNN